MKSKSNQVVVRMAPSPTGNLHIGTARTALFNYLYAKKFDGKFILRIEDTDKERSTKAFEANILEGLEWLGFKNDELYRQSERTDVYVSYLQRMLEEGSVYLSKEEPKEEGDRSEVIRFKNPNKKIVFEDLVRGPIEFDTTELGDFVVAKSETEPLYHLAVVVDDIEMGVTHIIRGEDHISNTPRQILIQEALGAPRPTYVHLPLILASDRSKLSKRKHGESVSLEYYRSKGYLPQAMVNYLALLGWNPGTEQEIFTLKELIEEFEISKIQKGGAIFDEKKLEWVNKQHINLLPPEEKLKLLAREFDVEREPVLDSEKIVWKDTGREETAKHLREVAKLLEQEDFEEEIMGYATLAGKGSVLWPLRYALSGEEKSPDPISLLKLIGKEHSLKRIQKAIEILEK